jgi:Zn-dependent M28 family amino/carboxypeptidase
MFIQSANPPKTDAQRRHPMLTKRLEESVRAFSFARHFEAQKQENSRVAHELFEIFQRSGYQVCYQGRYQNVVAVPENNGQPITLLCAHYDSVPTTPGADDNASGLAVMLEVARHFAGREKNLAFVAFNCEEDGLIGSRDFVAHLKEYMTAPIRVVHVLEMVGYCDHKPDSQRSPSSFLPGMPTVGDFLGLIANMPASKIVDSILKQVKILPQAPKVIALKAVPGLQRLVPDIRRSDHAPFWDVGIPAIMWTDTSEFRNPHYHRPTDTPDTLDYEFMASVTELLQAIL